jgi:dTDP-4-dehydrorhamnose 3,5-epimerase
MSGTGDRPIDGVVFEPRKVLSDERGAVLHHLRADSPLLPRFGEVYVSTILSGRIKAWKKHLRIAQNLSVPVGAVQVVIHDDRPGSPTRGCVVERVLQRSVHGILHIPAGLWYGFRGVAAGESVILNCVAEMHDPAESERLPADTSAIPYRWPAENSSS